MGNTHGQRLAKNSLRRCYLNYDLRAEKAPGKEAQWWRICLPMQETEETQVWSLGREDPVEKEMATCFSILAWEIIWTKEPGRLQSMGSQRLGHNWATEHTHTHTHTQAQSRQRASLWGEKQKHRRFLWIVLRNSVSAGTSLAVQWLRLCLLMQWLWVRSRIRELRLHVLHGQKPKHKHYCNKLIKDLNKWSAFEKNL